MKGIDREYSTYSVRILWRLFNEVNFFQFHIILKSTITKQKYWLTGSPNTTVSDSFASLVGRELVFSDGYNHVASSIAAF